MQIASYADLLSAARAQPQPQRLLFTFARAGLPEQARVAEQARYASGSGGTLTPVLCVDKTPDEAPTFASLVEESRHAGAQWDVAFVTSISGRAGQAASSGEAEGALKMMVAAIQSGQIDRFLAFDRGGDLLRFEAKS
ncbi:MAG: ribonucleotide reductase subunit alpha [Pseudomonadota bacterium]